MGTRSLMLAALVSSTFLSGCAATRGSQISVLTTAVDDAESAEYKRAKVIADFNAAVDEEARALYRAQVAAIFMEAIDESYASYTQSLFTEGVGADVFFETAVLAFSTAGQVVEHAADEFASATAAVAGLDSAIDKNLYFDRTLPALIATMDARRARIEAEIVANLQRSTSEYPIQMLLRDLRRFQNAGTLFRAIADVTADASENRGEAEAELQRQYELARAYSCVPKEDQEAQLAPLIGTLRAAYRDATDAGAAVNVRRLGDLQVRRLAAAAGANPIGDLEDVRNRILDKLDTELCTAAEIQGVIDRFQAVGGGA